MDAFTHTLIAVGLLALAYYIGGFIGMRIGRREGIESLLQNLNEETLEMVHKDMVRVIDEDRE